MGSIPITRSNPGVVVLGWRQATDEAHVAQSVEHVLGKDEVTGSIPVVGSRQQAAAGAAGDGGRKRSAYLEEPPRVPW